MSHVCDLSRHFLFTSLAGSHIRMIHTVRLRVLLVRRLQIAKLRLTQSAWYRHTYHIITVAFQRQQAFA